MCFRLICMWLLLNGGCWLVGSVFIVLVSGIMCSV